MASSNKASHAELPFHPARKNPLGEWVVRRLLVQRSLARAFGGVYASVQPGVVRACRDLSLPIIFCSTHTGWWDGHMAGILNQRIFHRNGYLMMEELYLAQYPFFTWAGVFGIDRHDARKALASIDYIVGILKEEPGAALWMFPQGTMTHPDARPIHIYSGASHIARRVSRCALIPIALRYDFGMEQAPDAFAYLGSPLLLDMATQPMSAREITLELSDRLTAAADTLHSDLIDRNMEPYRQLLAGRRSINTLWNAAVGGVRSVVGAITPGRRKG